MGNWRAAELIGEVSRASEAEALHAALLVGDLRADGHKYGTALMPLLMKASLGGLGRWLPRAGGTFTAAGNLAERDVAVEDVEAACHALLPYAPSIGLLIHLGGEFEDRRCVATVGIAEGRVAVLPPQVAEVAEQDPLTSARRLLNALAGEADYDREPHPDDLVRRLMEEQGAEIIRRGGGERGRE